MQHVRAHLFAAVCLGVFASSPGASAELRLAGTDLLGLDFSRALYECAGQEGLALALAFDGSRPGIDRLKAGRADLAVVVLPPEEKSGLDAFECVPLAYHPVFVLVPKAAPLAQVSLERLGLIFGTADPGGMIHWGDLGAEGEWADSPVALHAPAAGVGIAAEFFRYAVLGGGKFRASVARYDTHAELALQFAGVSRALALANSPLSLPGAAKMVAVARRRGAAAYLPTPENLHSGDYPLQLPLCAVFRRESASQLRPLLHLLHSDELALHFERAGFVPPPAAVRRRQTADLDKL